MATAASREPLVFSGAVAILSLVSMILATAVPYTEILAPADGVVMVMALGQPAGRPVGDGAGGGAAVGDGATVGGGFAVAAGAGAGDGLGVGVGAPQPVLQTNTETSTMKLTTSNSFFMLSSLWDYREHNLDLTPLSHKHTSS